MTTPEQSKPPTTHALGHYMVLVCLYAALIFILPPNTQALAAYNISTLQYHFILMGLVLPSLAIWLTAFVGYAKLRQYAQSVADTPEGIHFEKLTMGCMWLAWSLPLTAILPFILNAMANKWSNFHPAAVIISNYLNLFLPLVAFSLIAIAARGLMTSTGRVNINPVMARLIIFSFLTGGVLYCYLTFRSFDLSGFASTHNPYFLPIWLLILTITVPYLYAWFMGTLAVYELSLFTKQVRGILYQRALRFMIGGLIAVILSSIASQYINSLVPRDSHLIVDYHLLLISLFQVIGGVGFILLTIGAARLKKIEEI